MTSEQISDPMVPLIYPLAGTAVVLILAAVNWSMDAGGAARWAIAGLFLPVAWTISEILFRNKPSLREIRGSVLLASALMTLVLGFKAASASGLLEANGGGLTERAFGVGMGLVLVVIGNFIPKKLEPMLAKTCSPARVQSMQRFAGWVFVLGGLGYAAASAFLPLAYASTVAMAICASALLLVLGRWMLISASRNIN